MFGFIKRIRQSIKEKKAKARELGEKKIARIKAEIKIVEERAENRAKEYNDWDENATNHKNSNCPKCKSNNVNDRIKQRQGSINGLIIGSGWSAITFGTSHYSGSLSGDFDTKEVNKCNDCGNEWKKVKRNYSNKEAQIDNAIVDVIFILKAWHRIETCTFDALDLKEKYASLEEKKIELQQTYNNHITRYKYVKFWEGISIHTFEYFLQNFGWSSYCTEYKKCYNTGVLIMDLGMVHYPFEYIISLSANKKG